MTPEQKVAYIQAQAVSALAAIESMKAANTERADQGYAQAYDEKDFINVQTEYLIGHNSVIEFFGD
jgi:hypothetical protein